MSKDCSKKQLLQQIKWFYRSGFWKELENSKLNHFRKFNNRLFYRSKRQVWKVQEGENNTPRLVNREADTLLG